MQLPQRRPRCIQLDPTKNRFGCSQTGQQNEVGEHVSQTTAHEIQAVVITEVAATDHRGARHRLRRIASHPWTPGPSTTRGRAVPAPAAGLRRKPVASRRSCGGSVTWNGDLASPRWGRQADRRARRSEMMDQQQLEKVRDGKGFVAALDQSGGSTPKALRLYGVGEDQHADADEMFDRIHEMRMRIITSPSFGGDRVVGAILFEMTMDRRIDGRDSGDYLWSVKQ